MIWDVPPACPAAQPVLPISHQPRHNWADSGTLKIKVNPTKVRQEMGHPVHELSVSDVHVILARLAYEGREGGSGLKVRPSRPKRKLTESLNQV